MEYCKYLIIKDVTTCKHGDFEYSKYQFACNRGKIPKVVSQPEKECMTCGFYKI